MGIRRKKVEDNLLDVDASMQGSLSFKDPVNLRINGRFEGTLEIKGSLTIGATAAVEADIVGDNVIVEGRLKGKVIARESLVLLSSAIVEGDIFPAKLQISEGAILDGKCSMLHDYLSMDELARYLEVEPNSISEWASSGKIPATKEGSNWRFERKSVDAWIASGKLK